MRATFRPAAVDEFRLGRQVANPGWVHNLLSIGMIYIAAAETQP